PPEILQRLDCVASLKRAAQLAEFLPGMHDVGLPCRRQRFVCGGTARSEPGVLTLPKRRAGRQCEQVRQEMQEEIVEPDALITAAQPEMHVHAIYGHTPGQPLIPVDELVVPRRRRDDAVTVARKWMAACGREGNPEPLADVV